MRKFYIGTTEVQIEMSHNLVETLDETLDNMTVSLALNNNSIPYKPLDRFYVKEASFKYNFAGDVHNYTSLPIVGDEIILSGENGGRLTGILTYINYDSQNEYINFSVKIKENYTPFVSGEQIDFSSSSSNQVTLYLDGNPTYIETTEELVSQYVISSDRVELETQNPLRYKHTLTLMQLSEYLTHHEIRNTVFSTSLETNRYIVNVGAGVVESPYYSSFEGDHELRHYGFMYIGTKLNGEIDLSKKKINSMVFSVKFFIEKIIGHNGNPGNLEATLKGKYQKYNKWSDIYSGVGTQLTDGEFLPTINFKIGNEEKKLTLRDDKVSYGSVIDVSKCVDDDLQENILDWIKSKTTGVLEISILDKQNQNTILINDNFHYKKMRDYVGKIPMIASLSLAFSIDSVEMPIYDIIETLLKQQVKSTSLYLKNANDYLFKMPTLQHNPDLYNLLKNTSSPNFVFTQSNMYNALVEIFKIFDAIFTIDKDGYLDIEYYNDHNKITIPELAGQQSTITEEKYNNKLISYFQNTKIDDKFPNSNDEKATAFIRSKTLGVPGQSDYVFIVPKPIDVIKSCKLKMNINDEEFSYETSLGYEVRCYAGYMGDFVLDITNNVVDSSLWTILLNDTTSLDPTKKYKSNCFSYTRGSNYIDISGYYVTTTERRRQVINNVVQAAICNMFGYKTLNLDSFFDFDVGSGIDDFKNVKMSVEYTALTDGKLVIESEENKYNGEMIINQGNGSIDINKLGLNMVGLSLKLGQPTLTMTQKFTNWNNRIKKGQYIEINGERWVANVCNYTVIRDDNIQATIEFVKNFNGLASRIKLNREKRLSNISSELTTKCEETYGEYVYYSSDSINNIETKKVEQIALDESFLFNQLTMGFGYKMPSQYISGISHRRSVGVQSISINDLNNLTNADRKTIYKISGTLTVDAIENGILTVKDTSNNTLVVYNCCKSISTPKSIVWDDINNYLSYINPQLITTSDVQVGDTISLLYVIKDASGIICGDIENYPGLTSLKEIVRVVFENDYTIEYTLLTSFDKSDNVISTEGQNCSNISIPLVVYGAGNSVCFEMSFDSPMNAGNQLLSGYTSSIWQGGWYSRAVIYTDLYGNAEKFTINFVKMQEELTRCYPHMIDNVTDQNALATYSFGKLEKLGYYKKSNEIFALNYQLHFLPLKTLNDDGGFLSNEYIKNNAFKNGLNKNDFYIVYSTNENDKYSILDTKGILGTRINITNISNEITASSITSSTSKILTIIFTAPTNEWENIKSWAVVDANNNIYYSSNLSPSSATQTSGQFLLSFFTRHHKL